MLQNQKNLLVISALAVSLAACGSSQSATNSSSPSDSSASTNVSDVSPDAQKNASSPGSENLGEIKFNPPSGNNLYGYFDVVNGSSTRTHKATKTAPITLSGWAVSADKGKVADKVIITLADNKTVVAEATVRIPRPDVAQSLKNPAYKNSGWATTVNPASLPPGKSVLKAWSYNGSTKEATPLNPTHEIVIGE